MHDLTCGWQRRDPSQLLRYDCNGVIDTWDAKLRTRLRRTCGDAFNSPRPAEPLAYECAGRNRPTPDSFVRLLTGKTVAVLGDSMAGRLWCALVCFTARATGATGSLVHEGLAIASPAGTVSFVMSGEGGSPRHCDPDSADRHPMLSELRKQKRAVVVAQNPCSAHQHDAFYGLLTMMADGNMTLRGFAGLTPDPLAWAACRCGWIAGECSGGGGRFGTAACTHWAKFRSSYREFTNGAAKSLRALGDENPASLGVLLEATPHHFARGFTTRDTAAALPSLPFNGGTIGPDGFDEYRAQGTMWLHRTLQGAPPGDKWYSGSFELLVLWVHYGRPKGEWLASSLAAVLGVGNSAIATSLHQLFLAAEFAQHCRARVPALSSNEEWCGKRGQCSKAWSVARWAAVAAGDADCDPTIVGRKGLPAVVTNLACPAYEDATAMPPTWQAVDDAAAAAAHRVPFVPRWRPLASRPDAHVGVKVAAGKPVLDCAHRPFAAGVWDVDVVGLSEALRQRFNASHGRRPGRPL
jgi:hypothetical protein